MIRRALTLATGALVVAAVLLPSPSQAVWIPPGTYHGPVIDLAPPAVIRGKNAYLPRDRLGRGYWKLRAKYSSCPVTDGIAASFDELICVLDIPYVLSGPFAAARVIVLTEVAPGGGVSFFQRSSAIGIPAPALAGVAGGFCYPWDGGAYLAHL